MRMYIIRHGETEWNKTLRLQGRSDIPLNETGIMMAKKTAEGMADIKFTRAFSSPLIRAMETARIIIGDREITVMPDERIIEISFGINEGCEYDKTKPDKYPELIKFFSEPDIYVPAEGGETIGHLRERTKEFMEYIVAEYGDTDEEILIAAHGATIRGILSYVKGTTIRDFWRGGVQSNCGVTIMDVNNGKISIIKENITYYE